MVKAIRKARWDETTTLKCTCCVHFESKQKRRKTIGFNFPITHATHMICRFSTYGMWRWHTHTECRVMIWVVCVRQMLNQFTIQSNFLFTCFHVFGLSRARRRCIEMERESVREGRHFTHHIWLFTPPAEGRCCIDRVVLVACIGLDVAAPAHRHEP